MSWFLSSRASAAEPSLDAKYRDKSPREEDARLRRQRDVVEQAAAAAEAARDKPLQWQRGGVGPGCGAHDAIAGCGDTFPVIVSSEDAPGGLCLCGMMCVTDPAAGADADASRPAEFDGDVVVALDYESAVGGGGGGGARTGAGTPPRKPSYHSARTPENSSRVQGAVAPWDRAGSGARPIFSDHRSTPASVQSCSVGGSTRKELRASGGGGARARDGGDDEELKEPSGDGGGAAALSTSDGKAHEPVVAYCRLRAGAAPFPRGVDAANREAHLSDAEFDKVLRMSRQTFAELPSWKQHALKKAAGLF